MGRQVGKEGGRDGFGKDELGFGAGVEGGGRSESGAEEVEGGLKGGDGGGLPERGVSGRDGEQARGGGAHHPTREQGMHALCLVNVVVEDVVGRDGRGCQE